MFRNPKNTITSAELHNEQAKLFTDFYDTLGVDSYYDAFTYGRKQLLGFLFPYLQNHIQRGSKILDVGCGSGHMIEMLRKYGYEMAGIEPATNMREAAQKRNPEVQILDARAGELPFKDASFDAVLAIEIFRYLHQDECLKGYQEALRVLKPGGYFIFTMQNRYCLDGFPLYYALKRLLSPIFKTRMHYDHFTTPGEVEKILKQYLGSQVESVSTRGVTFAPLHIPYKALRSVMSKIAKFVEPFDTWISSQHWHNLLAGNLVVMLQKKLP